MRTSKSTVSWKEKENIREVTGSKLQPLRSSMQTLKIKMWKIKGGCQNREGSDREKWKHKGVGKKVHNAGKSRTRFGLCPWLSWLTREGKASQGWETQGRVAKAEPTAFAAEKAVWGVPLGGLCHRAGTARAGVPCQQTVLDPKPFLEKADYLNLSLRRTGKITWLQGSHVALPLTVWGQPRSGLAQDP